MILTHPNTLPVKVPENTPSPPAEATPSAFVNALQGILGQAYATARSAAPLPQGAGGLVSAVRDALAVDSTQKSPNEVSPWAWWSMFQNVQAPQELAAKIPTLTAQDKVDTGLSFAAPQAKVAADVVKHLPVDPTGLDEKGQSIAGLMKDHATEFKPRTEAMNAPVASPRVDAPLVTNPIRIDTPVQQPQWQEVFAQKIVWAASQQLQEAQIQLNPPNLGRIDVQLSLKPGDAAIQFSSPHLAVREAIQAASPRLIEMFAGQGLNLANVNVGEHRQQPMPNQGGNQPSFQGMQATGGLSADATSLRRGVMFLPAGRPGGVDLFA